MMLAAEQLLGDRCAVRHVDDDRRRRARRSSDGVLSGQPRARRSVHQPAREAQRLLADGRHADLVDDLVAGARRVERRHVRRAALESLGAVGVADRRRSRNSNGSRAPPSRRRRAASVARQIGPDVEVAGARPAAQPLHRAADGEVDAERLEVDRHGPGRLVDVEHTCAPTRCAFSIDRRARPGWTRSGTAPATAGRARCARRSRRAADRGSSGSRSSEGT